MEECTGELTASISFRGDNVDALTATAINNKDNLTLAVPTSGSAELELSVTNTGLDGTYAGNDAETTWAITGTNNTGAVIDANTGVLKITNSGRAGTVTVQATTKAGGAEVSDTADVTVTRAGSEPGTVTISGAAEITVPAAVGDTPINEQYTVTVTDQFGAQVEPAEGGIAWSIDGAAPTGVSIDSASGVLTVSSYEDVPAAITIKAAVSDVDEPALLAEQSDTMEVSLVRETSVASKVEISGNLTCDVPTAAEGGSASITPAAAVTDQYGAAMEADVAWSLNDTPAGISIDSGTGVITVTSDVAETAELTLTAAVSDTVTDTETVQINRAPSQATAVELYRGGSRIGASDTLIIPAEGAGDNVYAYTAKVLDQFGQEMIGETAAWTFTTADGKVTFADGTVTVSAGAEKDKTYTLAAECGGASASTTITVKDIDITWPTETVKQDPTYGDAWGQIVTLSGGSANIAGADVPGTFTVKDAGAIPGAGQQSYTINFTSEDGSYDVDSAAKEVTIAKRPITVTADDKTKTYGEENPALTWSVDEKDLVGEDTREVLTVNLSCTADAASPAGTPVGITGTGSADNYEVTVASGELTINPATVTITSQAPAQTILANDTRNTAEGLKALLNLPETVTITGAGAAATSAPITWADAGEAYNVRGGAYTYVGTLDANTNFANRPTLTATVTVTPVKVTAISGGEGITLSKSQVTSAADLADLGVDATVTLTYDQSVEEADKTAAADWDKSLADVQAVAAAVTGTSGDKSITLTLKGANIPAWATVEAAMPQVTITITNKYVIPESDITFEDLTVTYGEDYSAQLKDAAVADNPAYAGVTYTYTWNGSDTLPTGAGTHTITVTVENADYKGTKSAVLTIGKKPLTSDMITIDPAEYTYTGSAITPNYTVSDVIGGVNLIAESDYTVEIRNNVSAGENAAEVYIEATAGGNYASKAGKSFTINPKNLADEDVAVSGLPESVTYTGSEIRPLFTVTFGSIVLAENTDYTLSYENNTDAGSAAVKITGVAGGNYTGEKTAAFTIEPAPASGTVAISGTGSGENGAYAANDTLAAHVSGDKHDALAYQWYVNGAAAANETGASYTIKDGDESIYVVVTSSGNYVGSITSSAIEVGKAPIPTGVSLSVSGDSDPAAGDQLTATVTGGPEDFTGYSIQWLRDGEEIPGATGETYTLTSADKGRTISAKLVPGAGYTGELVSGTGVAVPATAPGKPDVTCTAGDGSATVKWSVDDNGGSPITQYQIQPDGSEPFYVDGDVDSYTFEGLTNGEQYTITVTAINAIGRTASDGISVTPKAPATGGGGGGGSSSGVTRYTITVEQNPGGEITPDTTRVVRGQDQTFRIRADEGYEIEDVLVDGESVGSVSSYTFENVRKAHTIEAVFRAAGEEPGQAGRPFTDVDPNGWAAEYIYYLYDRGVVSGVGANQFAPTRSITRAEFVKMLAGVAGVTEEELSGSSGFADVDSGSWYAPFVTWAVQSGVTTGTSATTFSPEANITREEMAVMIDRFAQSSGVELPGGESAAFTDAASFSSWATEAIYTMQRAGIIDGVGGGRFAPKDNATREQACKMLAVLMELM